VGTAPYLAGHQQSECPKKAVDVYRLPEQLQSKVDEMYAKVRRREVVLRTAMWVRVACSRRCRQFAALLLQDVARMNPGEAGKMDHEYKSFLAELGGGPPPLEAGAAHRGGASCLHRVAQFSAGIRKHAELGSSCS